MKKELDQQADIFYKGTKCQFIYFDSLTSSGKILIKIKGSVQEVKFKDLSNDIGSRYFMKTYRESIDGKRYQYFYDVYIRSWTVYLIDENGFQISESDYFANKAQMLKKYSFKFKTDQL